MPLDYLQHIRDESARFVDVLDGIEPTEPVPTCPGWQAADLLWHLGEVQYFWARIVDEHITDPSGLSEPERPQGYGLLTQFFRSADDALVEALERTPDDTPVGTFASDKHVRFVRRRQAHEALIHRIDAELVANAEPHIDAEFAADGVLEVLQWMFSSAPPWADHVPDGPTGVVRATDTGTDWLVRLGRWSGTSPRSGKSYSDRQTVTVVDDGRPTFEVSGAAADLDLWMWNRPIQGEVALKGDTTGFERVIAEGVQ